MDVNKAMALLNHIIKQEKISEPLTQADYKILRANQLSGTIYPLIKDQENLYKGFKEDYFRYIQRDEIQVQLIKEINGIFNQHQIDHIFLKGSYLKTLYPHSFMRVMGDIDILVRPESMDKVHKVLEDHHFKNWHNSSNHDCFMKDKINVEIHPKLDSEFSKDYNDLFLKPWVYASIKDAHRYHLSDSYRFYYQLYHMIKHLYHSGVGLRTFIDLYYLLNTPSFHKEVYEEIYDKFPKKDFVNFIQCLVKRYFTNIGLFEKELCGKINQNQINEFITYVIHSGTHGIGEDHNLFIGGMASKHGKNEFIIWTKIKFLFSKAFLPFKAMKGMYRYLRKYPFLLPLAYIQRIFSLLFRKSSRRKLKRMSANKEDIQYVEKLFIDIGIK